MRMILSFLQLPSEISQQYILTNGFTKIYLAHAFGVGIGNSYFSLAIVDHSTVFCLFLIVTCQHFCAGHLPSTTASNINLGLCTVNMAETADNALTKGEFAEMFATVALCIKTTFPSGLQFFAVSMITIAIMIYQCCVQLKFFIGSLENSKIELF